MQSPAIKQALGILNQLRQIMETPESVPDKLSRILQTIAAKMQADAAACYVGVDDNYLELFASYGFKQASSHRLRLRYNEGMAGEVAESKRSLVINNIWMYPKFVSKPELLEEKDFNSFIGVPVLQWNRTVGVLALYNAAEVSRSEIDLELLETIAMVLAEILSSEEMTRYKKSLIKARGLSTKERIKGLSLNKGYGIGTAVVHRRRQSVTNIFAEDREKELRRLEIAHHQMNEDLDAKFNSTKLGLGEHVDILDAYRMFAKDKGWRDVADRLQSYLRGDYNRMPESGAKDIVIVAQTMGPAELMDYDYSRIRGLILEDGTPTMHVAIVAKALNIPVLAKIKGIFAEIQSGQTVALDGNEGFVYVNPSPQVEADFRKRIAEREELQKKLAALRSLPAKTLNGVDVGLYVNVGLPMDFDYIETTNCDGVGLYRTEIPFMTSDAMPDVEKQVSYYKDLMDRCGDKKVIFRSLDVGSDKLLPYWAYAGEANPAIGWRSIRITLDRRAILRKQIRAFLLSAAGKELNVMFPMISDLAEFEDAKETLMIELEKDKSHGFPVPKKVNVGLMVEVPSVIFQLDDILQRADFVSVGTNDLAQFIFACDRGNPKLSERYDVLSAPFLNVMKTIVDKADAAGVYCSVCGEMASNPIEALALIGLGYRNLSSNGASFGRIKSMVRSVNTEEIADYMRLLLKSTKNTLRPQLIAYAYDHGIEIY